jgi:hypothetical protein
MPRARSETGASFVLLAPVSHRARIGDLRSSFARGQETGASFVLLAPVSHRARIGDLRSSFAHGQETGAIYDPLFAPVSHRARIGDLRSSFARGQETGASKSQETGTIVSGLARFREKGWLRESETP